MKNELPLILAIETSCDETSVALVQGRRILSNAIYSSLELHAKYGGVVPSIARLAHEQKFDDVLSDALNRAHMSLEQVEAIAVTVGPGLAIALEVGIDRAKKLATTLSVPLFPINHMEGHLLSAFANSDQEMKLPALGLLVSGGHTEMILVNGVGEYEKIGQTLDDACGEAFDKAAVMLGLGYPGGPAVSKLAMQSDLKFTINKANQSTFVQAQTQPELKLTLPMANTPNLHLSYSGLKTGLKQLINELSGRDDRQNIQETASNLSLTQGQKADLANLFEFTAIEILVMKLRKALNIYPQTQQLWVGGGVIANQLLREGLAQVASEFDIDLLIPELQYTGDNAAMIGLAASLNISAGKIKGLTGAELEGIDRQPQLSLNSV